MLVVVQDKEKKIINEQDVYIVRHLAQGKSVGEIATLLRVNKRTLEAQIGKLKDKFECKTLAHLVATFIRNKVFK